MTFVLLFWDYLLTSAPYLLLGLTVSGLIHPFLNSKIAQKHVQDPGWGAIFKATLIGVPLPLCSCAVIPVAARIRKAGASNGATSAFLISTPESGVDSIAITYGLMGGPMAILRPIAGIICALVAGFLQLIFNPNPAPSSSEEMSCCSSEKNLESVGVFASLKNGLSFSFGALTNDLALWMVIGLVAGTLIQLLIPESFFVELNPHISRLLVTAAAIPMYICASASTPIAASLMAQGMSPGVALLYLIVGPATNISSLLVLQNFIGVRGVLINVVTLIVVSLALSYGVDWIWELKGWSLRQMTSAHEHRHTSSNLFETFCALALSVLLIKGIYFENIAPLLKSKA